MLKNTKIKVVVGVLFVVFLIIIILISNMIYRYQVGKRAGLEEGIVDNTEEKPKPEDYEDYYEYEADMFSSDIYAFGENARLVGEENNSVLNHIESNYLKVLKDVTDKNTVDISNLKFFGVTNKSLGLSKAFLEEYKDIYIDGMLTVVDLYNPDLIVFSYGDFESNKELIALKINSEGLNLFSTYYEIGGTSESLKVHLGACRYEEYDGFKILYLNS